MVWVKGLDSACRRSSRSDPTPPLGLVVLQRGLTQKYGAHSVCAWKGFHDDLTVELILLGQLLLPHCTYSLHGVEHRSVQDLVEDGQKDILLYRYQEESMISFWK